MTRKDYVAISRALARQQPLDSEPIGFVQWSEDVKAIADVLASDNPRFDRQRFLFACASWDGRTVDAHAAKLLGGH